MDKRPIDANALRDDFREWCSSQTDYRTINQVINSAPTIDAVEVVHGRWMTDIYDMKTYETKTVAFDNWLHSNAYCSVCKTHALCNGHEEDVPSKYCPNCGAKMDGGIASVDY